MSNDSEEIDDVADLFNTIGLESDSDNETNMTREINFNVLKLELDSIITYDGNVNTLNIFINLCDRLVNKYGNAINVKDDINSTLVNAIIGKLRDRALLLIGNRTDIDTWQKLRATLIETFSDQRNVECLIQDIITLRPFKNETIFNFGQRCQDVRELVRAKTSILPITAAEKTVRIKTYDDLALQTFIRNIPGNIQMMIRVKNPQTIEQALSMVIEEENFLYSQNKSNSLNASQHRPLTKMSPGNSLFKPNQYQNQMSSFQNHFANIPQFNSPAVQYRQPQPSPFPRGPINMPQPVIRPQRYFTNAEVFGKPQYSGQTRNSNPNSPYTPTPMSTSTINQSKRNFTHFQKPQNFFRPTGQKPNFISQELNYNDQNEQSENFEAGSENYEPEQDPEYQIYQEETEFQIPTTEEQDMVNFPSTSQNQDPV